MRRQADSGRSETLNSGIPGWGVRFWSDVFTMMPHTCPKRFLTDFFLLALWWLSSPLSSSSICDLIVSYKQTTHLGLRTSPKMTISVYSSFWRPSFSKHNHMLHCTGIRSSTYEFQMILTQLMALVAHVGVKGTTWPCVTIRSNSPSQVFVYDSSVQCKMIFFWNTKIEHHRIEVEITISKKYRRKSNRESYLMKKKKDLLDNLFCAFRLSISLKKNILHMQR